jgi:hypothetical protein
MMNHTTLKDPVLETFLERAKDMDQAAGSLSRSPTPDLKVDFKPRNQTELIKAFEND